ncbi:MAG: hypothetical protein FWF57_02915 [Defluviitaleaceae bacterium]|nr:hypothetical protein [Defluviitaleaceae bacterium]
MKVTKHSRVIKKQRETEEKNKIKQNKKSFMFFVFIFLAFIEGFIWGSILTKFLRNSDK